MTQKLETELLIGVNHVRETIQPTIDFIDENYPQGPRSIMLEISPNLGTGRGFFSHLEDRYRSSGSQIVYGDRNLAQSKTIFFLHELGEIEWKIVNTLPNKWGVAVTKPIRSVRQFLLNHNLVTSRNIGMLNAIKEEAPQVVVVGATHADYLKEKLPHIKYVYIAPKTLTMPPSEIADQVNLF